MYNCNKFGVGDFAIYHKIGQVVRVTLVLQDFSDHYYYDVIDSNEKRVQRRSRAYAGLCKDRKEIMI